MGTLDTVPEPGMTTIYALVDPRATNGHVRYVGKTKKRLRERLWQHIKTAHTKRMRPVIGWIRKLETLGLRPIIAQLSVVADADANGVERSEIARFKTLYPDNTNMMPGGEGGPTFLGRHHSEVTRALMAIRSSGKHHSEETKRKISEALTGRTLTEAERIAARTKWTDVARENARKSHLGLRQTEETKRKRADKLRGQKRSEETRARLRAAWNRRRRNAGRNQCVLCE